MVRTSILLFFIDTIHLSDNANANSCLQSSFADPGCLSIPDPGYRIQQQQQKWRANKFVGLSSFVATNITKLKLFYCTKTNLS
jgi:hypothetical protein